MAYLTDQHVADLGLDSDAVTARRTLADAQAVYEYISDNPWVRPGELTKWAVVQWGDAEAADRMNAAVGVLVTAGKVVDLGQVPRTDLTT